jgi:NAD(P)H-dependent flavin oxidoreductase YrpB (nitropropane dioxygenase family)
MSFAPLKIGKYTIPVPVVQGGMGVGISWDQLAGSVSKEGGLGVISSVIGCEQTVGSRKLLFEKRAGRHF